MFRAILDLLIAVIVALVARAVLTGVMRSITKASRGAFRAQQRDPSSNRDPASSPSSPTGELHKDPICGTYVAESTAFRRQIAGKTFYYCSETCREKHTLVTH